MDSLTLTECRDNAREAILQQPATEREQALRIVAAWSFTIYLLKQRPTVDTLAKMCADAYRAMDRLNENEQIIGLNTLTSCYSTHAEIPGFHRLYQQYRNAKG